MISGMFFLKTVLVFMQQFVFLQEVVEPIEPTSFSISLLRLDVSDTGTIVIAIKEANFLCIGVMLATLRTLEKYYI